MNRPDSLHPGLRLVYPSHVCLVEDESPSGSSWLYVFSACFSPGWAGRRFDFRDVSGFLRGAELWLQYIRMSNLGLPSDGGETYDLSRFRCGLYPTFPGAWITALCLVLGTGPRSRCRCPTINPFDRILQVPRFASAGRLDPAVFARKWLHSDRCSAFRSRLQLSHRKPSR